MQDHSYGLLSSTQTPQKMSTPQLHIWHITIRPIHVVWRKRFERIFRMLNHLYYLPHLTHSTVHF